MKKIPMKTESRIKQSDSAKLYSAVYRDIGSADDIFDND
jgi:hypothetical protein